MRRHGKGMPALQMKYHKPDDVAAVVLALTCSLYSRGLAAGQEILFAGMLPRPSAQSAGEAVNSIAGMLRRPSTYLSEEGVSDGGKRGVARKKGWDFMPLFCII